MVAAPEELQPHDHRAGRRARDAIPRPGPALGESRLLREIGSEGASVRDLRRRLGLDSGHVSRLLRSLESEVLRRRGGRFGRSGSRGAADAAGSRERAELFRLSDQLARAILEPPTTPSEQSSWLCGRDSRAAPQGFAGGDHGAEEPAARTVAGASSTTPLSSSIAPTPASTRFSASPARTS